MIYQFDNLVDYLKHVYEEKKKKNSNYSLRAWSRDLGFNGAAFISLILNGKRKASLELIESLCRKENLTPDEERYVQLLYLRNTVNDSSLTMFDKLFVSLRPGSYLSYDFIKKFTSFSSYIPFFLVELSKVLKPKATNETYLEAVGHKVDKKDLDNILSDLVTAGMLTKENDIYTKGKNGRITFDKGVSNTSIKMFHLSSLECAKSALIEQDVSQRQFGSTMLVLPNSKYEEACTIINNAHQALSKLSTGETEDTHVYQFNTQLYIPIPSQK